MSKLILKILISIFSLILSILFIGLCIESIYRIEKKGFIAGIKSYFINEIPYSALGVDDWIISDPDLGYKLNPRQPGVNKFHMKDGPVTMPKPEGVKRVIILGDSIPYSGDPNVVDLLKVINKKNNNVEILNASVPGYTTYQELFFLEHYILQLQPDVVILSYCLNDNYKFLHQFDQNMNMLFTEEAKQNLKINNDFDKFISRSYFLSYIKLTYDQKRSRLNKKISKYWWDESIDFNTAWKDSSWLEFEKYLQKMKSLLIKQNATLLVVIFPLDTQIESSFFKEDHDYVLKPQNKVTKISNKYDVPVLDLYPIFYKAKILNKVNLFNDGIHLTTEGQILASQEIYDFLYTTSLISQ